MPEPIDVTRAGNNKFAEELEMKTERGKFPR
jgi:hypothetical protein